MCDDRLRPVKGENLVPRELHQLPLYLRRIDRRCFFAGYRIKSLANRGNRGFELRGVCWRARGPRIRLCLRSGCACSKQRGIELGSCSWLGLPEHRNGGGGSFFVVFRGHVFAYSAGVSILSVGGAYRRSRKEVDPWGSSRVVLCSSFVSWAD